MESADNTGHFDWDNFLSQHPHSLVTPSATYEELARTVAGLSPTKLTQIGYGFLAEIEPMRIMPAVKSILLEEYQAERGGLMTWLDIEIKKSREANKKTNLACTRRILTIHARVLPHPLSPEEVACIKVMARATTDNGTSPNQLQKIPSKIQRKNQNSIEKSS